METYKNKTPIMGVNTSHELEFYGYDDATIVIKYITHL